jgi:Flp pilus assembly protein TadB
MLNRLDEFSGGRRSLVATFILVSFGVLLLVMTLTGHSPHLFVSVVYLLITVTFLIWLTPAATSDSDDISDDRSGTSGTDN